MKFLIIILSLISVGCASVQVSDVDDCVESIFDVDQPKSLTENYVKETLKSCLSPGSDYYAIKEMK